jgi:hypothetical protein
MDADGKLTFAARDSVSADAVPAIVFSPSEAELAPGQSMFVRLSVIVPAGTEGGEYRSALIARPRPTYRPLRENQKRLEVRFRLAAVLYVGVPPLARSLELENLVVARVDERWQIVPTFLNRGDAHVRVSDTFEIFPEAATAVAAIYTKPQDETGVVLPGRSRRAVHRLPDGVALLPGLYRVVYRADAGPGLPLLEGETRFEVPRDRAEPVASRD